MVWCLGPTSAVMFLGESVSLRMKGETESIAKLRVSEERAAPWHIVDAESYCHRLAL